MALSHAASSSSSSPLNTRYDVFISFRGEDTRNGFTSHLHSALLRNQIETFIDYRIPKGGVVWNELVESIRDSKLFVVIFSENYASSSWCLRELVEIMECKKKNEKVIVIPVFYKIEPTHVRKQSGSYRRAFDEHERSSNRKHVQQWRTALTEASNLSGFPCDHHSLIQEVCWKIIHEESSKNCGQQTRLWNAEEICNKFQHEGDIHGVESMIVDMNEITINLRIIIISLRKMSKLKLLALRGNINMDHEWNRVLVEDFQLPNDLRYIEWNKYPLNFVPSICWPQNLVQLSMRESNIQKLWNTVQNLPSLEIIDLSGCKHLIECPNLIEELYLNFCTSLKRLCSDYCSPSLRSFWATGCYNLEEFSIPIMTDHSKLLELHLPLTTLSEVPSTIMHLKSQEFFSFNISYSLEKLPPNFASIIVLTDPIKHEDNTCIMLSRIFPAPAFLCVKKLLLFNCKSLSKLPENIHVLQSLQELEVESCHVLTSLPQSIKNLQQLVNLMINNCEMLQYIPPLPPSIIYFKVGDCKSLEAISSLTSEPPRKHYAWIDFYNCIKLDDDAYEAALKELKSRIELVANNDGYPHNEANNEKLRSLLKLLQITRFLLVYLVGCMLISQYQPCNLIGKTLIFGWECYLRKGCNEGEWIATSCSRGLFTGYVLYNNIKFEMVSDHKVVWYDGEGSNKITEAIKERKRDTACNPILKFKFYAHTEDNEEVVIKGCGIRWMHVHINHGGEITPDATHDEGYESHDLELEDESDGLEIEDIERTGERVNAYCWALDIVKWLRRFFVYCFAGNLRF
ncbi:TMV resistance protein N-like isoform X2 [Arachis stenosperma]|uniref:TMV resistance protein N-like isoform X2 n=1 Tax=Arachis stenosperma TaxID=217475 RepID=UPI0025AC9BF6|nr:TMV resistance protein N-like isoform X2 [Arachis stenosperma]